MSPDILDEIAQGKNEFTHMAIKGAQKEEEHIAKKSIENVAVEDDV